MKNWRKLRGIERIFRYAAVHVDAGASTGSWHLENLGGVSEQIEQADQWPERGDVAFLEAQKRCI